MSMKSKTNPSESSQTWRVGPQTANPQNNPQNPGLVGFLRLYQIIGDRKRGIQGLIPIGRTTFLDRVKSGQYPAPVKLGVRTIAWKEEDIRELIERLRN